MASRLPRDYCPLVRSVILRRGSYGGRTMTHLAHASRFRSALMAFSVLLVVPVLRAADPPKPATPGERIVKLIATDYEGQSQYVIVSAPEGGPTARLLLSGAAKQKYNTLYYARGELFKITVKP